MAAASNLIKAAQHWTHAADARPVRTSARMWCWRLWMMAALWGGAPFPPPSPAAERWADVRDGLPPGARGRQEWGGLWASPPPGLRQTPPQNSSCTVGSNSLVTKCTEQCDTNIFSSSPNFIHRAKGIKKSCYKIIYISQRERERGERENAESEGRVSNWILMSCQLRWPTSGHSNSVISKWTFQNLLSL